MNGDKAREYFSSYREGSLEGAMKQSFEQKLRSDRLIDAEYRAFTDAMDQLDELKYEEIPVPLYLNAKIQERLAEARKPAKPTRGVVFYLPRFAFAAAAAVAILFAAKNVLVPSHGQVAESGVINGTEAPPTESIEVEQNGGTVQIRYLSASEHTVDIRDGQGNKLKEYALKPGDPLKAELKNPNASASIFEVSVSDGGPDEFVAVPGTQSPNSSQEQTGNVIDFVKAMADRYQRPIIVSGSGVSATMSWTLDKPNLNQAVDHALEGTNLTESTTATGVLRISSKGDQ